MDLLIDVSILFNLWPFTDSYKKSGIVFFNKYWNVLNRSLDYVPPSFNFPLGYSTQSWVPSACNKFIKIRLKKRKILILKVQLQFSVKFVVNRSWGSKTWFNPLVQTTAFFWKCPLSPIPVTLTFNLSMSLSLSLSLSVSVILSMIHIVTSIIYRFSYMEYRINEIYTY